MLTNTNQSVIGAVASFILVGEQTGDFSLISEKKEKNILTNHIHALFQLKKFITSVDKLQWNGQVAKFFYKKIGIEDRLQENWWRGAQQQVRKGIDVKRSSVSTAIKNEFIRKYCAQ